MFHPVPSSTSLYVEANASEQSYKGVIQDVYALLSYWDIIFTKHCPFLADKNYYSENSVDCQPILIIFFYIRIEKK